MLTILYGGTGTGKSYDMMKRIREKAEANCNICAIVPDQFTFEYEKMLYDHLGCRLFNKGNIEVLSFSRLTNDIIGKMSASDKDSADPSAKIALLYLSIKAAADRGELIYFKKQAKRPNFISTASAMLSELIHSGVTPERLTEIIRLSGGESSDKLSDILAIYTEYTRRLSAAGLRDSLFDMRRAAVGAGSIGYFDGKYIFMDEFKSFTGDQYDMIRAMISRSAQLTVCITSDDTASLKGVFASAEDTCSSLMRIAAEEGAERERIVFSENRRFASESLRFLTRAVTCVPVPVYEENADEITVITAPDIYAECSYICSEIRELVSGGKYRYSDIAVLSRSMNEDISVLAAHFERYGIPYYSDKKSSAGNKPIMLMINSALELAAARRISTETVLRYAKTGLAGITDSETGSLENFCYSWDIDGEIWEKEFPADEETGDIESIKKRLLEPVYELRKNCSGKNGGQICAAVRDFIAAADAEAKLMESGSDPDDTLARENRRICEELDDMLAGLESAFSADELISLAEFKDIFTAAAANITLASPPIYLDGVSAEQSDLARLPAVKVVFVMQATDGKFPFIPSESHTFTESERELFKNAGSDLSGSMKKRLSDEKFNAYKAVCAPSDRLYISYSLSSADGKGCYPSEYINKITRAFPKCRKADTRKTDMLFYCRSKEAAYAAAVEHYNDRGSSFAAVKSRLEEDPLYKARFDYLDKLSERTAMHTVDPELMEQLYFGKKLRISASRFEDFSKCPFMYFCKTGLKLYPLSKKSLTRLNWGNAVHACMNDVLGKYCSETRGAADFKRLSRKELSEAVDIAADKFMNEQLEGDFGKTPDFPVYFGIMKENSLRALLRLQKELTENNSKFVPHDFELPVGRFDEEKRYCPSMLIRCDDGHTLEFSGTVDRVDLCEIDGKKYIRVIDYKTGKTEFKKENLAFGINWQMLLYLYSLTDPERGIYKNHEPAGVLYVPVRFPEAAEGRDPDEESVSKKAFSSLKASGVVLDNEQVINAMEQIDTGEGKFIPVKKNKDGIFGGSLFAKQDFDDNREKAKEKLKEMCRTVYSGNVAAVPNENVSGVCDHCDYREICGGSAGSTN